MSDTRPIPDARGYFVTDDGRVLSTNLSGRGDGGRTGPLRELRSWCDHAGYHVVRIVYESRKRGRNRMVHQLVAEAFHGPRPPGAETRHLDGCRTNNTASNLAWGTRHENMADRRRLGESAAGARNGMAKLTQASVALIRTLLARGHTQQAIGQRFGLAQTAVSKIKRGDRWRQH